MYDYDAALEPGKPAASGISTHLHNLLQAFVDPLRPALDAQFDLRLVRTCGRLLEVLILFRNRNHGLLLSELGAYLLGPNQAPAGTKRLSNLLRSTKWEATLIHRFLWQGATARVAELQAAGGEAFLLWDESVLEKPESLQAEGLGAVRSSKAARLKRIKPGFYNPQAGRRSSSLVCSGSPFSSWVSPARPPWRGWVGGATALAGRWSRPTRGNCAAKSWMPV